MKRDEHVYNYFEIGLAESDPDIYRACRQELQREQATIELIPSENIVSRAVLEAQGTVFTNKYAEGYPGRRYYGGCEPSDVVESLAIERACQLFKCQYANVQPHSGAQANQAVYLALLEPGDKVLGMRLDHGGHLTHGSPVNLSGKWFQFAAYGVTDDTQQIDFNQVEGLALSHRPKMIVCGASAYSRAIPWQRFRAIADAVGAYLLVDAAHYAGLIAAGEYPDPLPHADIVTSTTHKTLRGPRGGLILSNSADLGSKINKAIFPGLQGGPLMHVIAAKAVAFKEALQPQFRQYARQVIANARALAATLQTRGLEIVSGGTDSHVLLVDLRKIGMTGKEAQERLERAGLTCNKNTVPNDPQKALVTSGIRLGTPAGTTRGFAEKEFTKIGDLIADIITCRSDNQQIEKMISSARTDVTELCRQFPIYSDQKID